MYTVLVTTYQVGEQGAYQLQIMPGGGGTPAAPATPAATPGGQGGDPFRK